MQNSNSDLILEKNCNFYLNLKNLYNTSIILTRLAMWHCIVGGIPEDVDEKVLHAAFIPFGDIMDIQIPLDYETGLQSFQHF